MWYFCSPDSRAIANAIQAQLAWHPAPRFIEVSRFEEIGPCYRELRRKLPEVLLEAHVNPADVLVDYTGGTKTMSAALVLATTELFGQFSYVGGAQREKGGLGITVEGQERVHYQNNPWQELAVREVERAGHSWAAGQFEPVARLFREVASRVPHPRRFAAMATLADGLGARQRLDFAGAKGLLTTALGRLRPMFEAPDSHGPIAWIEAARERCEACAESVPGKEILTELLDNALRTADEGRFDDAAARLYRAMELQGQLWLAETTEGRIICGKCRADHVVYLPPILRAMPCCQPDGNGEIKLASEQVFQTLAVLGHARAQFIVADLTQKNSAGNTESRWRAATEKRNSSILAHGLQPVGATGFEQMKRLATEFLGFDLSRQTLPIPPLDSRWFT